MAIDIWNRIKSKKLRVTSFYKEKFKDIFANFGKQTHEYCSFGPFYELYLYCFIIGYHSDNRVILDTEDTDTFNMIGEWKKEHQLIFRNLITLLICDDGNRNEIDFDFISMEIMEDNEIMKKVNDLITIFEEFANGGFEELEKAYNKDPEEFSDFRSLYAFFDEKVNNSKRLKSKMSI